MPRNWRKSAGGKWTWCSWGNSITQNWEHSGPPAWRDFQPAWQHYYGNRNAVNLGFSGDATCHLLWRLRNGEIDGITPRAAVILIGANNLGRLHWPAADDIAGIVAVVDETRRKLPQTRVLLLAVLPSERSDWASETTLEINRALAARAWAMTFPLWTCRRCSRRAGEWTGRCFMTLC